jgi:hypothetical protein
MRGSIRMAAREKRRCLHSLRRQRRSKRERTTLYILVFATLLYLLLEAYIEHLDEVVVDTEFPGHEGTIKVHVLNLFWRKGIEVDPDLITFRQIGKDSPAHHLAISVFRGKPHPDREITSHDVLAEFR